MSFCRFSSDDWKSDVYAYESDAGFVVYVAASRLVGDIPVLPSMLDVTGAKWAAAYKLQMEVVHNAKRETIGGQYDGKSFIFDTLIRMRIFLWEIKSHGYRVPDFVFLDIEEEIKDNP
jgi:hypothetical protein